MTFPPDGWRIHPTPPFYWNTATQEVITEEDLRARYDAPKRKRATKAEMAERKTSLFEICKEQQPMSVRGVFYQAVARLGYDKEKGYGLVQRALADMRKAGTLDYDWIVDLGRGARGGDGGSRLYHAYSKAIWADMPFRVQVWIEKDALVGVVMPIISKYNVRLYSAKGYSSLSLLKKAAEEIEWYGKPTYIFQMGDYDPSGESAGETIDNELSRLAPNVKIYFEHIAVEKEHIEEYNLPTRPVNFKDTRAAGFGSDEAVDLDALPPNELRRMLEEAIQRVMPEELLIVLKEMQKVEQRQVTNLERMIIRDKIELLTRNDKLELAKLNRKRAKLTETVATEVGARMAAYDRLLALARAKVRGWLPHPEAPGWYYKGQEVLAEEQLIGRMT